MEVIDELFNLDSQDILENLPKFQSKLIKEMTESGKGYIDIADQWLSAKPENTVGFGGQQVSTSNNIYRDKIMEELEKFICGDKAYNEERKKLGGLGGDATKVVLGVIAHAIGTTLGTAGAFILPIVALLILSGGKITKNGWCAARKQIRLNEVNAK